ncbi:hypothetical protein VSR34_12425, partial [Paraburkholderia sp. JHI2823]|uniref:hypothetical protein n=1 Tax=Paraburkholderia sp. JHI2823 TaxID=3112960 RepID=UPI00316DE1FF
PPSGLPIPGRTIALFLGVSLMNRLAFTEQQLLRYITALHEAAHTFIAHHSRHWQVLEPAVTFPAANTGHLARAHFGPKVKRPKMRKKDAREFIKIGYAGLHGQNLIGQGTLLSVMSTSDAGCEDDFAAVDRVARASGIATAEKEKLFLDSAEIILKNAQTIHALANVISSSDRDIRRADLFAVLGPSPRSAPGWWEWLKSLFAN